jgi:hypothetical protein
MFIICFIEAVSVTTAAAVQGSDAQLLSGDRVLLGTAEGVRSDQARIHTGDGQPRFIPMNVRRAKGLQDLKKGDLVEVTVNESKPLSRCT